VVLHLPVEFFGGNRVPQGHDLLHRLWRDERADRRGQRSHLPSDYGIDGFLERIKAGASGACSSSVPGSSSSNNGETGISGTVARSTSGAIGRFILERARSGCSSFSEVEEELVELGPLFGGEFLELESGAFVSLFIIFEGDFFPRTFPICAVVYFDLLVLRLNTT
jgi:hypothetical protein